MKAVEAIDPQPLEDYVEDEYAKFLEREFVRPGIGHNSGEDHTSERHQALRIAEHENHILACKRVPIRSLLMTNLAPPLRRFMAKTLEQNQQVASCCRQAEEHDIEAWYSSPADAAKGIPDIYIITCGCGRWHRFFCVGGSECPPMEGEAPEAHADRLASSKRPFWEVR